MKKLIAILLIATCFTLVALCGCSNDEGGNDSGKTDVSSGSATDTSASGFPTWNGNSVTYNAANIAKFGSGTPYGYAKYDSDKDNAVIWNTDASLDNYGGVQTPRFTLDFSKAVTFKMRVVECYSQYIVKLAVEGENEYYYVLSDESKTGEISVNVVDSMLSEKYRNRNTQPDPGYRNGWKYDGQKKNCSFHILAKGPDGESQTAELIVKQISVFNNETAVTGVTVSSDAMSGKSISARKASPGVDLTAEVYPASIQDRSVIWESLDESVATVDAQGKLDFVGVGKTQIVATSATDQSKSDKIDVNVTSGYEDPSVLKAKLVTLTTGASQENAQVFTDMFKTTWADDAAMTQAVSFGNGSAARMRSAGMVNYVYNHYDPSIAAHKSEADRMASGDKSYLTFGFASTVGADVYRLEKGELTKETINGTIKTQYLKKSGGSWSRVESYQSLIIVVGTDGSIRKTQINVVSCEELSYFTASDFADSSLWTIPDRARQSEDRVVHALSPASVRLDGDVAVLKQNKYDEAKYCFGGIVGNILHARSGSEVEIIVDVRELNKMNEYVKTMWEVKIIYYDYDDTGKAYDAVSSNPIKLGFGNDAGVSDFTFRPTHEYFRLYLVVNGSDIGAQFKEAQMKIAGMQIYCLD